MIGSASASSRFGHAKRSRILLPAWSLNRLRRFVKRQQLGFTRRMH